MGNLRYGMHIRESPPTFIFLYLVNFLNKNNNMVLYKKDPSNTSKYQCMLFLYFNN